MGEGVSGEKEKEKEGRIGCGVKGAMAVGAGGGVEGEMMVGGEGWGGARGGGTRSGRGRRAFVGVGRGLRRVCRKGGLEMVADEVRAVVKSQWRRIFCGGGRGVG